MLNAFPVPLHSVLSGVLLQHAPHYALNLIPRHPHKPTPSPRQKKAPLYTLPESFSFFLPCSMLGKNSGAHCLSVLWRLPQAPFRAPLFQIAEIVLQ
jgi:hypothetical protein